MNDLLKYYLEKGLANELNGNRLAGILYELLKSGKLYTSSRATLMSELRSGKWNKETLSDFDFEQPAEGVTDDRFVCLLLKNIKKFPEEKNGKYYGIQFCDDTKSKSVSTIFLGSNGVGKTSLYSSLEFVGTQKTNTAIIRGYNNPIGTDKDKIGNLEPDQSFYLDHLGMSMEKSAIIVKTQNRDFVYDNKMAFHTMKSPFICDAFYCSDYDVRRIESCEDFSEFFIDQIGLGNYYSCLQLLYYIGISLRREKSEIEKWILGNSANLCEEYRQRFKLGIILGIIECKLPQNAPTDISFIIDTILNENDKHIKNVEINKFRSILDSELKVMPQKNWFAEGMRSYYEEILKILDKEVQNGESSNEHIEESDKNQLRQFNNSRISFLADLAMTTISLKESNLAGKSEENLTKALSSYIDSKKEAEEIEKKASELKQMEATLKNNDFWDEYTCLVSFLESSLKNFLATWSTDISATIKTLLSEYFRIDNDDIVISIVFAPNFKLDNLDDIIKESIDTGTIRNFIRFDVKIMTSDGDLEKDSRRSVSPRAYLNTFKYKLFCVALKLAFCCVAKKVYSLNYPFIIDDVFDSSDFDNRLKLRDFVRDMMIQHDRLLPEQEYALQFIFFTQDELIADQFVRGILDQKGQDNVRFARIYDYHESTSADIRSFSYTDNDGKECRCEYVSIDESIL